MIATQHLFIAHGAFGRQIQHVIIVVRTDNKLQSAEESASATAFHTKIIAAYSSAPTGFVYNRFVLKTGKVIGHLSQTLLDVLGELEPTLRVPPAAFFFTQGFRSRLVKLRCPRLFAALAGSL